VNAGISWLRLDASTASALAVGLLVVAVAGRRRPERSARVISAAALEAAVVCALFGLWQVVGGLTRGHFRGGYAHGEDVWHLERWLHLPSEIALQRLFLGHHDIVRFANYFYDTMHLTLMLVFLVWLWVRHRDRYPYWRNTMVGFTAMALLVQIVPVAPPRLIAIPMVDTAMAYHQSVYAALPSNLADVYAAMPSIHVGWSVLIGVAVLRCSHSRWRWLALLHPLLTVWAVVVTANHYWLDGAVAVVLLVLAGSLESWRRRSEPARAVLLRLHLVGALVEPQPVVVGAVGDRLGGEDRVEVDEQRAHQREIATGGDQADATAPP
jgi:hypothetical protein